MATDTLRAEHSAPTRRPAVHFVCCLQDDRPFCGVDDGGRGEFTDEPADCVVCVDIWETLRRCPFGGSCTPDHGPTEEPT